MKIKTQDLTGPALDWAVAKCEEYPMGIWFDEDEMPMIRDDEVSEWKPSTDWSQGGPIIEREEIAVRRTYEDTGWTASKHLAPATFFEEGSTPLVAAMRCYVASMLGDTIDVPEELA